MKLTSVGIAGLLLVPSAFVFGISYCYAQLSALHSLALAILASFAWSDAWYFINQFVHNLITMFCPLPKEALRHVMDVYESNEIVSMTDIDRNGHYNNARYLRACGFGRRNFWKANGVWHLIRSGGGNLLVGAQTVRYRRELALGQRFKLQTRIRTWDNQAFYIEHRFVTGEKSSEFIHAIVLVKNNVTGPNKPQCIMNAIQPGILAPEVDKDIEYWIDSNKTSSSMLRPKKA